MVLIFTHIPSLLFAACVALTLVTLVKGHGRLYEPPARSTMWRRGFNTKKNWNDNELNCGGFGVQWDEHNQGKCGVCGDPYRAKQPRANEGGGTYGKGVIARRYVAGQAIDVIVQITANHKGYFMFSVCPHNDPLHPATEKCFEDNPLSMLDGSPKWTLVQEVPRSYALKVKLPETLTCTQCVFRWKWRAGNNWAVINGVDKAGQGPQEHFFGCSDIAISAKDGKPITTATNAATAPTTKIATSIKTGTTATTATTATTPTATTTPTAITTPTPTPTGKPNPVMYHCFARGLYEKLPGLTAWCNVNCDISRPVIYCPPTHCLCMFLF